MTSDESEKATEEQPRRPSKKGPPSLPPPPQPLNTLTPKEVFFQSHDDKTPLDIELIRLALHRSPFFTCLDEEQIERFIQVAELRTYEPSQVVFLEGEVDEDADSSTGVRETFDEDLARIRQPHPRMKKDEDALSDPTSMEEKEDSGMPSGESTGEVAPGSEEGSSPVRPRRLVTEVDESNVLQDEDGERYASIQTRYTGGAPKVPPPKPKPSGTDTSSAGGGEDPTIADNFGGSIADLLHSTESDSLLKPQGSPNRSGRPSLVYTVRTGQADVWTTTTGYDEADSESSIRSYGIHHATLGPGTCFGEGGFLFGRQHSATILASSTPTNTTTSNPPGSPLECWVVPLHVFRQKVLPSDNMVRMFRKYASQREEGSDEVYMSMDDFCRCCLDRDGADGGDSSDPNMRLRMANTYNILRRTQGPAQKIGLADFCLFHLLMARPDPEVDIAFLLMDSSRTGKITLNDFQTFVERTSERWFDMDSEFIRRHFGKNADRVVGYKTFPQFLADYQREMGRQAFLQEAELSSSSREGYLSPAEFVRILQTACGWQLPTGLSHRLEDLYIKQPLASAEATALALAYAEKLKGSSSKEASKSASVGIMAQLEKRTKNLGDRVYGYGDFLAFQEVLAQLPGILNLIHRGCEIKNGPISPDDFKVANRVIGMGDKLSRRQVEIIFELFDLDQDGFISSEDAAGVVGLDFVYRLEAVAGREGKLTFAPPPTLRDVNSMDGEVSTSFGDGDGGSLQASQYNAQNESLLGYISNYAHELWVGSLAGCAGAIAGVLTAPADLVKTRMMMQRIQPNGVRMYNNTLDCLLRAYRGEGWVGLFRGTGPYLLGIAPQRAFQLSVHHSMRTAFTEVDEKTGKEYVPMWGQVFAGGCAGACQVLFANPLELAKIQLQQEGETARLLKAQHKPVPPTQSMLSLAADLGVPGLYRGSASCLLRDIPFSAIFFPTFFALKDTIAQMEEEDGGDSSKYALSNAAVAGALASIPASLVSNPADVIKTRLQAPFRSGDIVYSGLSDAAAKIYKFEGATAFFKGFALRILRMAPQLSLTMATYEYLVSSSRSRPHSARRRTTDSEDDFRKAYPTQAIGSKTGDIVDGLLGGKKE